MRNHFLRNKGFTLVELLVVVGVIAVLSAVSLLMFRQYLDKARRTVSINALENVRKLMETYSIDNGTYPVAFNFTDCTDGGGKVIVPVMVCDQLKKDLHSLDSYMLDGTTYTLIAKAIDSTHTVVKLSSNQVVVELP